MPRINEPPHIYDVDERIELRLEPFQFVDLVQNLGHFSFHSEGTSNRCRHHNSVPVWRLNGDDTFSIVRMVISSPDVFVEATVERDMYTPGVFGGPWMTDHLSRSGPFLIVPIRMNFTLIANNPTTSMQHAVIYLRNRMRGA